MGTFIDNIYLDSHWNIYQNSFFKSPFLKIKIIFQCKGLVLGSYTSISKDEVAWRVWGQKEYGKELGSFTFVAQGFNHGFLLKLSGKYRKIGFDL